MSDECCADDLADDAGGRGGCCELAAEATMPGVSATIGSCQACVLCKESYWLREDVGSDASDAIGKVVMLIRGTTRRAFKQLQIKVADPPPYLFIIHTPPQPQKCTALQTHFRPLARHAEGTGKSSNATSAYAAVNLNVID